MLKYLNIKNFIVISQLEIEFFQGLNLLTGETGTGKSIIVDALELLLGGRGGADLIRAGESKAVLEAVFELSGANELKVRRILEDVGVDAEGVDWIIRREVSANGRSRIFINDQGVTSATVKTLQPYLIEITGQGEQQVLASSRSHLEMLDSFANCGDLLREVADAFARWRAVKHELEKLVHDEAERERVSDFLRFQITEIENISPQAGEDVELESEKRLLTHAEQALELSASAYSGLYESEQSALEMLGLVRRRLHDLASLDKHVVSMSEGLESAIAVLTDIAESLRSYSGRIDFSPERLSEIENRLGDLERLKRKYGRDLNGIGELKREMEEQLQHFENVEERRAELSMVLEAAEREYERVAERLSSLRHEAKAGLEDRVTQELGQVAMERASFKVSIESGPSLPVETSPDSGRDRIGKSEIVKRESSVWTAQGIDRVEFLLSANVGEPPRPLTRVASGGELSRLMLTLRNVCRGSEEEDGAFGATTLVFDEVDAGIGGRAAEAVGRRLKSLAQKQQILCVTHQPQIARFADHHYAVTKSIENNRTVTAVKRLDVGERISELARMIGGAENVEAARETARWMLENRDAPNDAEELWSAKNVTHARRRTLNQASK